MQFVNVLTVRNPLMRRSLGVPRLPREFKFQALQFPMLGVEIHHRHPPRIFQIETEEDLRRLCEDALSLAQAVRAEISSSDPESFTDAELLQVWAADLCSLHLVEVPSRADYTLNLPLQLSERFPFSLVREIAMRRLGIDQN